jgi:hypothetical protein
MTNDRTEAKLQELRTKTDKQLAVLIGNRLDRGLSFARVLESHESRGHWASTGHFVTHAEQAATEASAWLPLLPEASLLERRRLEWKLVQLRDLLDRVATPQVRVAAG